MDQGEAVYPRELRFVSKIEECTDAIFGVKVAVVLYETETAFDVSNFFSAILNRCDD